MSFLVSDNIETLNFVRLIIASSAAISNCASPLRGTQYLLPSTQPACDSLPAFFATKTRLTNVSESENFHLAESTSAPLSDLVAFTVKAFGEPHVAICYLFPLSGSINKLASPNSFSRRFIGKFTMQFYFRRYQSCIRYSMYL